MTHHSESASTSSIPAFVYGTLRAKEVISTLLRKTPQPFLPNNIRTKAFLPNHTIFSVKNQRYPAVIPSTTAAKLVSDSMIRSNSDDNHEEDGVFGELWQVSEHDVEILDWYEQDSYTRELHSIKVMTYNQDGTFTTTSVDAFVYIWCDDLEKLNYRKEGKKWDYSLFRSKYLDGYIKDTVIHCRDCWNTKEYFRIEKIEQSTA
jgi:gamma-glutamylcyclotransferase (GGCT)/AIG2-like uncharacterized protein YtfP